LSPSISARWAPVPRVVTRIARASTVVGQPARARIPSVPLVAGRSLRPPLCRRAPWCADHHRERAGNGRLQSHPSHNHEVYAR